MSSEALERFIASVRAPLQSPEQLDEFDVGALSDLEGDERRQAEDLLLAELNRDADDWRIAAALAEMKSPRAVDALRGALRNHPFRAGYGRVAAAKALNHLTNSTEGLPHIIDVLRNSANWEERRDAAKVLKLFPGIPTEQALWTAASDPHDWVRHEAVQSLFAVNHLQSPSDSHFDRLGMIWLLMGSELESVRQQGLESLHDILNQLRSGKTAQSLGLDYVVPRSEKWVNRFFKSTGLPPPSEAFKSDLDYEALVHLQGGDRLWAEEFLLKRLEKDPRAARALAQIGSSRAVAPLREILSRADGLLAIEAGLALLGLASDDRGLPKIVEALETGDEETRARAAAALQRYSKPQAEAALQRALEDPAAAVRLKAAAALLHLASLELANHRSLLDRLQSADVATHRQAANELRALL